MIDRLLIVLDLIGRWLVIAISLGLLAIVMQVVTGR